MADILFKCFECSRHLVAETERIGAAVVCGECKEQMLVPEPDIAFQCPKCQAQLAAPSDLAGEAFRCTKCGAGLVVPQGVAETPEMGEPTALHADMLFICSACAKHLAVDTAGVGTIVNCTECGQQVLVPQPQLSFPCPACEAELAAPSGMSGEPFDCPGCGATIIVPSADGE